VLAVEFLKGVGVNDFVTRELGRIEVVPFIEVHREIRCSKQLFVIRPALIWVEHAHFTPAKSPAIRLFATVTPETYFANHIKMEGQFSRDTFSHMRG
jgi:hypothetical protein